MLVSNWKIMSILLNNNLMCKNELTPPIMNALHTRYRYVIFHLSSTKFCFDLIVLILACINDPCVMDFRLVHPVICQFD